MSGVKEQVKIEEDEKLNKISEEKAAGEKAELERVKAENEAAKKEAAERKRQLDAEIAHKELISSLQFDKKIEDGFGKVIEIYRKGERVFLKRLYEPKDNEPREVDANDRVVKEILNRGNTYTNFLALGDF